jgi:hypothetical protein
VSQEETPRHAKRLTGFTKTILAVVAGALLVAACGVVYVGWQLSRSDQTIAAQETESKDVAADVQTICAQGGTAAVKLVAAGLCEKTKEIVERPGPVGPRGDKGASGPKGDTGPPGTPCAPTNPACRGPRGAPGPAPACLLAATKCVGPTGVIGPKGVKGDKGDSVKGDKGDPGESVKGDPGESIKGDKGEPGQSPPCLDTPMMCQGAAGQDGAPGPACPDGYAPKNVMVLTTEQPITGEPSIVCQPV